jgi:hypothetical protein
VADAPWRCSQCGTVNEPVANACRTCGRWPSLFDLEQETIDAERPDPVEDDPYAAQSVDVGEIEPESFEVDPAPTASAAPTETTMSLEYEGEIEEPEAPKPAWRRLGRLIVPIAFVIYLVVRSLAGGN